MCDIRLSKEKIIQYHDMLIERTGGGAGIRDEGILESAVMSPFQTFCGRELYWGLYEQAAALGYFLINDHPFVDGNKRIGMLAMLTMMEINRQRLNVEPWEVAWMGWAIARGEMKIEHIETWLYKKSDYYLPEPVETTLEHKE